MPGLPRTSRSASYDRQSLQGNADDDNQELRGDERFGIPGDAEPRVMLRVCVLNIYEINAQERTWQGKIDLEASWHDPTLLRDKRENEHWPETDDTDASLWPVQCPFVAGEKKRWTPRLNIENLVEDKHRETWYKVYTKYHLEGGSGVAKELAVPLVVYRVVLHGVFTLEFRPHKFPFDVQELPIRVFSNRAIPEEGTPDPRFARLVHDTRERYPSKVFGRANLLAGEWDLDGTLWLSQGQMAQRTVGREYPVVEFKVKLHRRAGFYVYSIWLPNFLLVTLAFLVLKLEVGAVNDRVNLVLTLLLASIGYRANIELPRTSTFSWLEGYLLVCIGALFLLALFSYRLFGDAQLQTTNVLTTHGVPPLILVAAWGICRDQYNHRGACDKGSIRMFNAIFAAVAVVFLYATVDFQSFSLRQVRESLDSPAELCFFVWLFSNVTLFMLYCWGGYLQPEIDSTLDQGGALEAAKPILTPQEPAAAKTTRAPSAARPARSPARPKRTGSK